MEAAAGSGMSPAVLNLLCIGALLAVLFYGQPGDWLMFTGAGQMKCSYCKGGAVCCPGSDITGGLHLDVCQLSVLFNLFYRMKGHFYGYEIILGGRGVRRIGASVVTLFTLFSLLMPAYAALPFGGTPFFRWRRRTADRHH